MKQIGNITLHRGDCVELMTGLESKSIDMIFCDLPYGTTACKWDSIIPFDALWNQYVRVIKDNGAIVLTASQPFTSALIMSNINLFKYEWIWQKTHPKGHLNAKKQPMRSHESVLIFYKNQPTYNPQKTQGHSRKVAKTSYVKQHTGDSVYGKEVRDTNYDSTERYPLSIQVFPNADLTQVLHPTQKPVQLVEYMIRTYSNEGELILDNCSGSGTTGVACINLNRRCILMEKDYNYYNLSIERLQKHVAQQKLF
jgi:DNA modification methylase